jgi:L-seryl-tRNA(Ser) seleniumtransferase
MSQARHLPAVHALVEHVLLDATRAEFGHAWTVAAARSVIDENRETVLAGADVPSDEALAQQVQARLARWSRPRPGRVINATGVIVHTNLGRSPVSRAATAAMTAVAQGYSDLEYDVDAGSRGSRHDLVEPLLCQLTGAESALVVNNNAGAVLLALTALARGRDAVISRGHLVEIGGGFRIPDIMAAGGANMVEVGTTNRTHLSDFAGAVSDRTAMILRVHTSNFRVVGFVNEVPLSDLVALGREHGLVVVDDLGSGSLLDTSQFGLAAEPLVAESLSAGADLVTFSGDKLLGAPQAGLIVGRSEAVARLRQHPFTRALRPGKSTLAGLHATLLHYARGEALEHVPVWRMISASEATMTERASAWLSALTDRGVTARTAPGQSARSQRRSSRSTGLPPTASRARFGKARRQ